MIDYFLKRLNLSKKHLHYYDFKQPFTNENKDLIISTINLNSVPFFQESIGNLRKQINNDQLLLVHFETLQGRIKRIKRSKPLFISKLIVFFEFFFHRLLARIYFSRFFYRRITKGRLLVLSKAEGLGRLIFAGFRIEMVENIDGFTFVLLKPELTNRIFQKPSYGPIFKMQRVGLNGKFIGVYKLRTMHPYSEFLHDYLITLNGYNNKGKLKNDFRVTKWGKFFRKYWIDELPQLINVLKCEMKIVGLRPVSKEYFDKLPLKNQLIRKELKPGCIPPYIGLNRDSSKESVLKSEIDYYNFKQKYHFLADFLLFFKALYFIIFKGRRGS